MQNTIIFQRAGLCIGNTDSRHYTDLAKDIYRFAPTWIKPGDTQRYDSL